MKWYRLFVMLGVLTLACGRDPVVPEPEEEEEEEESPGIAYVKRGAW